MSEITGFITIPLAAVALLSVLVLGPVACSIAENESITERVQAACQGDLSADAARASACTLALTQRGR